MEPNDSPPLHSHDHSIPLIPGAIPSNVQPYQYPMCTEERDWEASSRIGRRGLYHTSQYQPFLFSGPLSQKGRVLGDFV